MTLQISLSVLLTTSQNRLVQTTLAYVHRRTLTRWGNAGTAFWLASPRVFRLDKKLFVARSVLSSVLPRVALLTTFFVLDIASKCKKDNSSIEEPVLKADAKSVTPTGSATNSSIAEKLEKEAPECKPKCEILTPILPDCFNSLLVREPGSLSQAQQLVASEPMIFCLASTLRN